MNKISTFSVSLPVTYKYVNISAGFWIKIILYTHIDLYVRFKHKLQEAPIYLTFEARTKISMVSRKHLCPKSSWYVYLCISSRKPNKIRIDFIHPPLMASLYISMHTGVLRALFVLKIHCPRKVRS